MTETIFSHCPQESAVQRNKKTLEQFMTFKHFKEKPVGLLKKVKNRIGSRKQGSLRCAFILRQ